MTVQRRAGLTPKYGSPAPAYTGFNESQVYLNQSLKLPLPQYLRNLGEMEDRARDRELEAMEKFGKEVDEGQFEECWKCVGQQYIEQPLVILSLAPL